MPCASPCLVLYSISPLFVFQVPLKDVPISFFATEASGRMMATLGRTLRRTMRRTGGSVMPWAGATGGRRTTRDGKAVLVEQVRHREGKQRMGCED